MLHFAHRISKHLLHMYVIYYFPNLPINLKLTNCTTSSHDSILVLVGLVLMVTFTIELASSCARVDTSSTRISKVTMGRMATTTTCRHPTCSNYCHFGRITPISQSWHETLRLIATLVRVVWYHPTKWQC